MTNKTLTSPTITGAAMTSPVLTTPQINDTSSDHQYVFAVSELAADRTVTLPLLTDNDTFVFAAFTQTLTNKTLDNTSTISLTDSNFTLEGGTANALFDADSITTNRTFTFPDASTTFVGTDATQTLTNKTLTTPVIASISNSGTITIPTGTDTLVARDTTDTLTNKTLTAPVITSISNSGTITIPTGTDTLVARNTTDTLTNKTLTAPVISTISNTGTITLPTDTTTLVGTDTTDNLTNKTFTDAEVDFSGTGSINIPAGTEAQRPGTPTDGAFRFNSDNATFEGYDGNGWGQIGGAGTISAFFDDFETGVADWSDSGAEVSVSQVTSGNVARENASAEVAFTASSTTSDYAEAQFTLPSAYANKTLALRFWHIDGSTNGYAADQMSVVLVKDPGGTETEYTPATSSIPSTSTWHYFETYVTVGAADTYAVRFKDDTGSTAMDIRIDDVFVGIEELVQGVPYQDLTSTTLTATHTTATTTTAYYSREGQWMTCYFYTTYSGAPNAALLEYTIPEGLTIDETVSASPIQNQQPIGQFILHDEGTTDFFNGIMVFSDSTTVRPRRFTVDGSDINAGSITNSVPITIANGDDIQGWFRVPIAEWAGSSVNLSVAKAEYAYTSEAWTGAGSTTVLSPSGQAMSGALSGSVSKTITWPTAVQPTDAVRVQVSQDQIHWFDAIGAEIGSGDAPIENTRASGGSHDSGVTWRRGSSVNETIVTFRQYMGRANDDSPTVDWPSSDAYWRVVKYPGVIQSATPNAVKWQKKYLSSDVTSDGAMSDLTYTLEAGKTYRISAYVYYQLTGADVVSVEIKDGSTEIAVIRCSDGGAHTDSRSHSSIIYTMSGTSLTFEASSASASSLVLGDGTAGETWVQVEELPTHVAYTGW